MNMIQLLEAIKKQAIINLSKNSANSKLKKAILLDAKDMIEGLVFNDESKAYEVINIIKHCHHTYLAGCKITPEHDKAFHYDHDKKYKDKMRKLFLNGADSWEHYSHSGCGRCYNYDIKEHYFTPSVANRIVTQWRGKHLLDWQAIYLSKSYGYAFRSFGGSEIYSLLTPLLYTYSIQKKDDGFEYTIYNSFGAIVETVGGFNSDGYAKDEAEHFAKIRECEATM